MFQKCNFSPVCLILPYEAFGFEFINPNFADFARSCGGDGYRVESPDEVDSAILKAFSSPNVNVHRPPGVLHSINYETGTKFRNLLT